MFLSAPGTEWQYRHCIKRLQQPHHTVGPHNCWKCVAVLNAQLEVIGNYLMITAGFKRNNGCRSRQREGHSVGVTTYCWPGKNLLYVLSFGAAVKRKYGYILLTSYILTKLFVKSPRCDSGLSSEHCFTTTQMDDKQGRKNWLY